jgi:tetrahydromethanopterin S-methyltransferase subunit C
MWKLLGVVTIASPIITAGWFLGEVVGLIIGSIVGCVVGSFFVGANELNKKEVKYNGE